MRNKHLSRLCVLVALGLAGWAGFVRAALVSHWKLDDGAGSSAQDSAGANGGTLVSNPPPAWVGGKLGGALSFSGTNTVRVANASSLNPASVTVSAWLKTTDTANAKGIVDKNTGGTTRSGYWMDLGATGYPGRPRFGIRDGSVAVTVTNLTSLADDAWHMVTGVFANTGAVKTISLYVDGLHKTSSTTSSAIKADTDPLCIGGDGSATLFLRGLIDDVALWNHPLNAAQVRALHGLASFGGLRHDAGQAQALLDFAGVAAEGSNLVAGTRRWTAVTGLVGSEGVVTHTNGGYQLPVGGAGGGIRSSCLLSRWNFDEGAGQTVGDPAFRNDGTLGNSNTVEAVMDPTWTATGRFGNALSFDGVSNLVRVGSSDALNPPSITVSAWVKTSDTRTYRGIVDKVTFSFTNTGYWLDLMYGAPRFGYRTTDGVTPQSAVASNTVSVADGNWHLLTGTVDGSGATKVVKLYVDGDLKGTAASSLPMRADVGALHIGGDNVSTLAIEGLIDDVGLWNRALSEAEAKALSAVSNHPELGYDVEKADALLSLFQDQGSVGIVVGGRTWYYIESGLEQGSEGDVRTWYTDDLSINLGDGAGVATFSAIPPPGATVLLISQRIVPEGSCRREEG